MQNDKIGDKVLLGNDGANKMDSLFKGPFVVDSPKSRSQINNGS